MVAWGRRWKIRGLFPSAGALHSLPEITWFERWKEIFGDGLGLLRGRSK